VIVCHCEVVSDRRIRREVEAGALSVDEVADRCGAGAHCGSCRPTIGMLVATNVTVERVEPAA
jgi:bacterioferritin-associated ferredoxin